MTFDQKCFGGYRCFLYNKAMFYDEMTYEKSTVFGGFVADDV